MLDWLDFCPILVVPAVPNGEGIRFLRQDKQLDIDGYIVETLWAILAQCNGYKLVEEIAELSGVDEEMTKEILLDFLDLGVIIDSRKQYLHFHSLSNNPSSYTTCLTREKVRLHQASPHKAIKCGEAIRFEVDTSSVLHSLQAGRKSCRSFSDEKLTLSQIGNICDYAYSLSRHAVPSGGGLYPLKIYCLIVRDQDGIEKGYYEYTGSESSLVCFEKEPDLEHLKYCFNDVTLAFNSPVQVIIAADLERQTYKYANRGYRLTLIEVGQAAQNICLYCEEQGVASCELGGILDEELMLELGIMEDKSYPLLGIAVGKPSSNELFSYAEFLENLENLFVGEGKPVKAYGVHSFPSGDAAFFGAWSRYGNHEHDVSGGTGVSYSEAACKAIIEGYERYRSGQAHIDYDGAVSHDRVDMVGPNVLVPLDPNGAIERGLRPYTDGDEISWTKGMMGDKKVLVPTDVVYYGHKNPQVYYGNSSGVAAFSDNEGAKWRALAELIERDALMRSWYEKRSPNRIAHDILPIHTQRRAKYWEERGRQVHVLDMNSPYLPVFQVVIVSENYPCFASGAVAATDSVEVAINKSLQEAEYILLLAMRHPMESSPKFDQIRIPTDHGHFYNFAENAKKIDWLWTGAETIDMPSAQYNMDDLAKELNAIIVDMSEPECSIKVVRALSAKLIPISFGYGLSHHLHSEVQKLTNFNLKSCDLPHYFA